MIVPAHAPGAIDEHDLGEHVGEVEPGNDDVDGELVAAMRELNGRGAQWVVISDGGRTLWATSREAAYRLQPPRVQVVNPIGCGDCLTAGLVDGLQRGIEFVEALRWGVAVAAANAEQLLPADFELARVTELHAQVAVS